MYWCCVLILCTKAVFCDSVPGTHDDSCQCFLTITALPSVGNCQHCQYPARKGKPSFTMFQAQHGQTCTTVLRVTVVMADCLQKYLLSDQSTKHNRHSFQPSNTLIWFEMYPKTVLLILHLDIAYWKLPALCWFNTLPAAHLKGYCNLLHVYVWVCELICDLFVCCTYMTPFSFNLAYYFPLPHGL